MASPVLAAIITAIILLIFIIILIISLIKSNFGLFMILIIAFSVIIAALCVVSFVFEMTIKYSIFFKFL